MRSGIATNMEGLEQATMGIAIADVDGNARPDVFTTNFSSDTNTLHLNLDGSFFDDRTAQFGLAAISRPLVGWAAGFFDFDHDGDEDLLVVNGHVYPQASKETMDSEYEQRPLLMERRGGRFEPVREAGAWKLEPHRDRTAVFADLDRDGDIDIVIGELDGPLRIIRNDHDRPDDWVQVRLADRRKGIGNRHGIGAVVTATPAGETAAAADAKSQRRWLWAGGPFMSNADSLAHFGVRGPTKLEVLWPDGRREERVVQPGAAVEFERTE
jgi:hypothetical protein